MNQISQTKPSRPRKFSKGDPIKSIEQFKDAIKSRKYVYINGKLTHWAWAQNMNFGRLSDSIDAGRIHSAYRDPSWPYVFSGYYELIDGVTEYSVHAEESIGLWPISARSFHSLRKACIDAVQKFAGSSSVIVEIRLK